MTKAEFQQKINNILNANSGYGFEAYACLQNSRCVKFILEDKDNNSFKDVIADKIASCVSDIFLSDIELKQVADIHDNTNSFYEIVQNEDYSPFDFLESPEDSAFSDSEKSFLTGMAFKFSINNNFFWAYQQIYPVTIPQKKVHIYMLAKTIYIKNSQKN